MDAVSTLGKLLPADHGQRRDAVHVAVMPVIAGEFLHHAESLRLKFGTSNVVLSAVYNDDYIGIVDPFIGLHHIDPGQQFWMWLRPGTITGLRHEWSHAAIDVDVSTMSESERWLRVFAEKWNFNYDEMLEQSMLDTGIIVARGYELHDVSGLDKEDEATFWAHIEKVTGKRISKAHKNKVSWSCTC